jgi:uncharacterized protein
MELVQARPGVVTDAQQFLVKVYTWMAFGLVLTGLSAYFTLSTGVLLSIIPYITPIALGTVLFAMALQMGINRISSGTAAAGFVLYSVLIGVVLSPLFVIYTEASIAKVFFITAATFGGMSLYGLTTRSDLSSMGSLLLMAFWGIFVASIANIWIKSDQMSWVISFIGVFVFTGLAAYYNQRLLHTAQTEDYYSESGKKSAIIGALHLYITFINLFISLMRLMGDRR